MEKKKSNWPKGCTCSNRFGCPTCAKLMTQPGPFQPGQHVSINLFGSETGVINESNPSNSSIILDQKFHKPNSTNIRYFINNEDITLL